MKTTRLIPLLCAVLTTLIVVAACGSVADDSPVSVTTSVSPRPSSDGYEVSDRLRDATMVWSAEPGVDLLSSEGMLIRASEESFVIGLMLGLDYAYLGFAKSSGSLGGGGILGGFRDDTGQGPFAGTIHGRVQQIIPIDGGFDVLSCVLAVGLDRQHDGKYAPSRLTGGEGSEQRSRFVRTGESSTVTSPTPLPSASSPDLLHWQAPSGNEFVGWEIDGFIDQDPATSRNGRCAPWARSLYPDVAVKIPPDAYAHDNPPPVQPAYPGWPDDGN
ncbi:hypothetical protein O1W68_20215 [Rhodococcus sp. H36-A4]|uniref:hypothetical protein n=1 Tax=Rhodococcus sp. H36-A4 TaxID=3004353 RepID=UPI0022B07DB2|nr:hypothetical protein [Rhodococcus sp. H36-A4]MCZ4080276.1 hypothetical protein [Rhodococcus sp. H36-A4]